MLATVIKWWLSGFLLIWILPVRILTLSVSFVCWPTPIPKSHVHYRFVNKRGEKMLSVKAMVIISLAIDNESVFTMNLPYTSVNGCMVVDRKMRNSWGFRTVLSISKCIPNPFTWHKGGWQGHDWKGIYSNLCILKSLEGSRQTNLEQTVA